MPTPKKPRCKLCKSDRPLPYGEDTCEICRRVCPGCGRRIPYSGKGRPFDRCPDCRELHKAAVICPCGRRVPIGRRRYCSDHCARQARRYFRGRKTIGYWKPDFTTVESLEGDHNGAAVLLSGLLRMERKMEGRYQAVEDTIILDGRRKLFTARHTQMTFDATTKSLPEFLPIDDAPRYEATPEPERGYVLFNKTMTYAVHIRMGADQWPSVVRRERWVPRYGSLEMWLMVPRGVIKPFKVWVHGQQSPFGGVSHSPQSRDIVR